MPNLILNKDVNTRLLYHFDNNTDLTINKGIDPTTLVQGGSHDVSYVTGYKKFGSYSAYIYNTTGNTCYFKDESSTINWENNKRFTVDFWLYIDYVNGNPNTYTLFKMGSTNYLTVNITCIDGSHSVLNFIYTGDTSGNTATLSYDVWRHVAIVRDSDTNITMYIDGSSVLTLTISDVVSDTTDLYIGNIISANYLQVFIDELRVSNDVKWVGNFVPFTMAYDPQ